MSDNRCASSCQVVPGVLKRCVLAGGHKNTQHAFIEARNRSDGYPQIFFWDAVDSITPDAVYDMVLSS